MRPDSGLIILALFVVTTALVYWPGLTGGFAFDDFPNIIENRTITAGELSLDGLVSAMQSGTAGPLKRPLPMASFALNFHLWGIAPFSFKVTNIAIHLINGILVYVLIKLLLGVNQVARGVAFRVPPGTTAAFVAGLWMLHPINLTSVLFVVQRMNSLAAGFVLLAMIFYCLGRIRAIDGRAGGAVYVGVLMPLTSVLGALCKENALLAFPLAAAIELCFFRLEAKRRFDTRFVAIMLCLTVLLPAIAVGLYWLFNPQWFTTPFAGRPFSALERGLTEGRVIGFYLSLFVFPRLREMGLFHDNFVLSTGMFAPPSTAFALVAILTVIVWALACHRRYPLAAFAVLWFAVGHAMESTVFPLELVHEHRNYLPGIGVLFGIVIAVEALSARLGFGWIPRVIGSAVVVLLATMTCLRAGDWSDPITLAMIEAERNPSSYRTVYELGRVQYGLYLMNDDEDAYTATVGLMNQAAALDPEAKRPLLELIKLVYRRGGEPDASVTAELSRRYAHALFRHNEWVDLQKLVTCRAEPDCRVSSALVYELYSAALSNTGLSDHARAQLMVDFALYYANDLRDFKPAAALLRDATVLRPDALRYRVILAEVLIHGGSLNDAQLVIDGIVTKQSWRERSTAVDAAVARLQRSLADASTSTSR